MVAATKLGAAPAPGFTAPEEPRQAHAIPEQPRQPSLEQVQQPASSCASQAASVEEAVPSVAVLEPEQEDARPVQKNTSRCFCCNKKVREASYGARVPRASLSIVWPNCQDTVLSAFPCPPGLQVQGAKCREPSAGSQVHLACIHEVVTSWLRVPGSLQITLSVPNRHALHSWASAERAGCHPAHDDVCLSCPHHHACVSPSYANQVLHALSAGGADRLQVPRLRLHILWGTQNTRGSPLSGARAVQGAGACSAAEG